MKVAIPTHSGKVDDHFGHCEYFMVFTTNDKKEIIHEEIISSPDGCGCRSDVVEKLSQIGVKVMLAGNIGGVHVNANLGMRFEVDSHNVCFNTRMNNA